MSDRAALELQLLAQQEILRRRAEAPVLYAHELFANHPKQKAFLDAAQTHRRVWWFGANQCGKTTGNIARQLASAIGYYFWQVPNLKLTKTGDLPARDLIPIKHWCRRTDGLPMRIPNVGVVVTGLKRSIGIGENLWPALRALVPEAWRNERLRFHATKGSLGTPENVVFPNGSRIIYLSEEQENWNFEGFVADWAAIDEPVRSDIFNALQARLMANSGPIWATLTPLGARSMWMLPYLDGTSKDDLALTVTQIDNPGLTDEQRRQFADNPNWSAREKKARVGGEFEVLGDRVFEAFDETVHVVPARPPAAGAIHGMTVDPHHRKPAFMLWWTFDPATRAYHFYREWPADRDFSKATDGGLTPVQYGSLIRTAEGRLPARHRLVDPRFGKSEHTQHGVKSTCWVDQMAELGLYFDAAIPNVGTIEYGHQVISDLLYYDQNFPVSPTNAPRLTIARECKNLINSMKRYGFLDVKDPVKGLFRKVSEEYKDAVDTVRYTVLYQIPATQEQIDRLQRVTPEQLEEHNNLY